MTIAVMGFGGVVAYALPSPAQQTDILQVSEGYTVELSENTMAQDYIDTDIVTAAAIGMNFLAQDLGIVLNGKNVSML